MAPCLTYKEYFWFVWRHDDLTNAGPALLFTLSLQRIWSVTWSSTDVKRLLLESVISPNDPWHCDLSEQNEVYCKHCCSPSWSCVFKQGRGSQKSVSFMLAALTTAGSRGRPPWIQDKVFPAWEQWFALWFLWDVWTLKTLSQARSESHSAAPAVRASDTDVFPLP